MMAQMAMYHTQKSFIFIAARSLMAGCSFVVQRLPTLLSRGNSRFGGGRLGGGRHRRRRAVLRRAERLLSFTFEESYSMKRSEM